MGEQMQRRLPQFKIRNRTGSMNITLKPAHFAGETFSSQTGEVRVLAKGHLMIEVANATGQTDSRGNPIYDWDGKVTMKLSDTDIQQILNGLQGASCQIIHDPNKARSEGDGRLAKSCLQVNKGERFGYFMTISRGESKVKCPLSDTDAATLGLLMRRAVIRIYGW